MRDGALAELLPPEAVAGADAGADRWRSLLGAEPEAWVRPGSTAEVASILAWAGPAGVAVVTAGSGMRLPPLPLERPFIVLSTERLGGVEAYEPADLTLTAAAGTRLADLQVTMAQNRQWLPFDPPGAPERTLGGLVASGASGPLWTGYGELRNHVLGATLVCGDGRVLRLGGRVVKNVAGFDLLRAVVGSRGRLGVITSVCVRVFPVPEAERLLFLAADTVAELATAARGLATAPTVPAASVLLNYAPAGLGGGAAGDVAALVVRLQGASAAVDADRRALEDHLGTAFHAVPDGQVAAVLEQVRDHASTADAVLRVTVLPSRLQDALELLDPLGDPPLVADPHAAEVRVGLGAAALAGLAAAGPQLWRELKEGVEELGGSVGVDRWPHALDRWAVASTPTAGEADLIRRVERMFDPDDTLWKSPAGSGL